MVYGCNVYFVRVQEMCDTLANRVLIHTGDEMVRHAKHLSMFQLKHQRDVKYIEQDMASVMQSLQDNYITVTDIIRDMAGIVDKSARIDHDVADLAHDMVITDEHFEQIDRNMKDLRITVNNINETAQKHDIQLGELLDDVDDIEVNVEANTKQNEKLEQNHPTKERIIELIRMHFDWIVSLKTEFPSLKRQYPKRKEMTPEEYIALVNDLVGSNRVLLTKTTQLVMDKYFDVEKHDMIYTMNYIKHHRMQPEYCKSIVADLGKFNSSQMMPSMCINISKMNPIPSDITWWLLSIPDLGESESDWEMRFLEQVLKVCKDSYTRYKSYKYACDQTEDL